MGPAAILYAARIEKTARGEETPPNLRDALMTGGIFLLTAAAFGVLFGTLYPLGYDMATVSDFPVAISYPIG